MALGEGALADWEVIRLGGIWEGEKPQMTMVRDTGVDAGTCWGIDSIEVCSELLHGDSDVVEPDRSGSCALLLGFFSASGEVADRMVGSGAVSGTLASMISTTIFSRSLDVMCLSRPRLRLLAHESCRNIRGRAMSSVAFSLCKMSRYSSPGPPT